MTSVGKMTKKNNITEKIVEIELQNLIRDTAMGKNLIESLVTNVMKRNIMQINVRIQKTIKY